MEDKTSAIVNIFDSLLLRCWCGIIIFSLQLTPAVIGGLLYARCYEQPDDIVHAEEGHQSEMQQTVVGHTERGYSYAKLRRSCACPPGVFDTG